MNKVTLKNRTLLFSLLLLVSCSKKIPSTYEIHYRKGLKDSLVFVNYNFSSDSSSNFYLEYNTFTALFKNKDYDALYKYHCSHPGFDTTFDHTEYKPKGFYFNNNPEDAEYYQSSSSSNDQQGDQRLKPSSPYRQPSRPYNYVKRK